LPLLLDLVIFVGARPNRPVQQIVHKQYVAQMKLESTTLTRFVF
jgi:hypothetical protein